MSLRIGVDLDGTLADLSSEFRDYEERMFGRQPTSTDSSETEVDDSEPTGKEKLKVARKRSREHDAVWRAIKETTNFWTRLKPLEATAVRDLQQAADRHGWEVFFVTQRPRTAGASVQKQSQEWLMAQGFVAPSVLTLTGSRGKAAHALELDFLIDDLPKNCIDVISDSKCRPILVVRQADTKSEQAARQMKIGVVRSVGEAIQLLATPTPVPRETVIARVLKLLGLNR